MKKNNYVKPTMRVVELKHRTNLILLQSGEETYIPGMSNQELNKLA